MNHKDSDPGGESQSPHGADINCDADIIVQRIDVGQECLCAVLRVTPPGEVYALTIDGVQWWPEDAPAVLLANFWAGIHGCRHTSAGDFLVIEGAHEHRPFACVVRRDEFRGLKWVDEHVGPGAFVAVGHESRLATAVRMFSLCHDQFGCGVHGESGRKP